MPSHAIFLLKQTKKWLVFIILTSIHANSMECSLAFAQTTPCNYTTFDSYRSMHYMKSLSQRKFISLLIKIPFHSDTQQRGHHNKNVCEEYYRLYDHACAAL